jgi:hypothetical protein
MTIDALGLCGPLLTLRGAFGLRRLRKGQGSLAGQFSRFLEDIEPKAVLHRSRRTSKSPVEETVEHECGEEPKSQKHGIDTNIRRQMARKERKSTSQVFHNLWKFVEL